MKKYLSYLIIAATIIGFSGCKKDSGTATPAICGLWQVTSSTVAPNMKFVKFNTNKTLVAYFETAEGFRTVVSTIFTPSTDQVVANFQGYYYMTNVYNYSVAGDVLTVIGDNGQTFFVATKSTSTAPDTWVSDVTSSDNIQNLFTNNSQGLGFDGSNLLFSDYDNRQIVKVSLATRVITSQITTTLFPNTVEYDGTDYWVASNGSTTINKVNASGTTTFTSTAMGAWHYGIGYVSPTSIVCYSNNERSLYNYNPATDVVTGSKNIPDVNLGDIAISNGKAYIIQRGGNLIYRLNPTTFAVEKTYRVAEANSLYGIASVGSNSFWLNTNSGKTILKVELN